MERLWQLYVSPISSQITEFIIVWVKCMNVDDPSMLQRLSAGTEFACSPFFLKDPRLKNLRVLSEFETLVGSLQAK